MIGAVNGPDTTFDLVLIQWEDIATAGGWAVSVDDRPPCICADAVFVVIRGRTHTHVASGISLDTDGETIALRELTVIPNGVIRSTKLLGTYRVGDLMRVTHKRKAKRKPKPKSKVKR